MSFRRHGRGDEICCRCSMRKAYEDTPSAEGTPAGYEATPAETQSPQPLTSSQVFAACLVAPCSGSVRCSWSAIFSNRVGFELRSADPERSVPEVFQCPRVTLESFQDPQPRREQTERELKLNVRRGKGGFIRCLIRPPMLLARWMKTHERKRNT